MIHKVTVECILVEDEKKSRELLERYISEIKHFKLIHSFSSFASAKKVIVNNPEAVLFLDIFLKEENTIRILENIILKNPIVFITGHKQFAHSAFDLDAIDYLIKPITRRQFNRSILKIDQRLMLNTRILSQQNKILIIENRIKYYISLNDIFFVESDKEYCLIHTINRVYRMKIALKKMELELNLDSFCRIHRSFIVNIKYVKKVFKNQIEINNKLLPISKTYKSSLRNEFL